MDEHELGLALARLCDVGVRLAIDDFGTGSSVLGRLQGCPIDTLKIDRSFVSAINVNRSGAADCDGAAFDGGGSAPRRGG